MSASDFLNCTGKLPPRPPAKTATELADGWAARLQELVDSGAPASEVAALMFESTLVMGGAALEAHPDAENFMTGRVEVVADDGTSRFISLTVRYLDGTGPDERIAELEQRLANERESHAALRDAQKAIADHLLREARGQAEHWREEWAIMSDDDPDDPDPRPPLPWETDGLTRVADAVLAATVPAPVEWSPEWPTEPGWYVVHALGHFSLCEVGDTGGGTWHVLDGTVVYDDGEVPGLLWGPRIPEPPRAEKDGDR